MNWNNSAQPRPPAKRAYYSERIATFLAHGDAEILHSLTQASSFAVEKTQHNAWMQQITIMRLALKNRGDDGLIAFEYAVPRVGRRIDVLVVLRHLIFVIEFKVGERKFNSEAIEQVWDYALDLKNFHSASHNETIVPILVATHAPSKAVDPIFTVDHDRVIRPVCASSVLLTNTIDSALAGCDGAPIDIERWLAGRYTPTPTIVEAAKALYGGHGVKEISRSDASAINLSQTTETVTDIIRTAKTSRHKALCFVTGVPGAGKTLVGLNIATQHMNKSGELYSVFLSGNGPLVSILCEALARDKARRLAKRGDKPKIGAIRSEVNAFVQNVHHFRDECLRDPDRPPVEHVTLFDEAQRAWNKEQTASFMHRKKGHPDFVMSEPEFLISCMDRHEDWAVVVCLVGGGQEINTGEAGIGEWLRAVRTSFPHWHIYLSPNLQDSEYEAGKAMAMLDDHAYKHTSEYLHLGVSMRSFRAEDVSGLVKAMLDLEQQKARELLVTLQHRYPIVLCRNLNAAKKWLKNKARGSERFGVVVSSQAQRLKPHAIDVRAPVNPIHWFLHPREDVRSSYYLEDAATEFHVQGLELDWACVVWDADFRHAHDRWDHWSFKGNRWQRIRSPERQSYLKNAYRVLLTRSRQGMIIVVPQGDAEDPTRADVFYDSTFQYLQSIGIPVVG